MVSHRADGLKFARCRSPVVICSTRGVLRVARALDGDKCDGTAVRTPRRAAHVDRDVGQLFRLAARAGAGEPLLWRGCLRVARVAQIAALSESLPEPPLRRPLEAFVDETL